MPQVLTIESPASLDHAVAAAVEALRKDQVVVVPTETVYGLAANALSPEAVGRIFEIKGRPSTNPVIVHVASREGARQCIADWNDVADALAKAFWPGPLTIVGKKTPLIPKIVTAGGHTVAVRWPSHPFMQRVINACGFPLAAPSANLSTQISATTAEHAVKALGDKVGLIIDAGPSAVGIESTVVDLTSQPPRVLRPGMISARQIEEALQTPVASLSATGEGGPARSPGLMAKHYAPRARLLVASWISQRDLEERLGRLLPRGQRAEILAHTNIPQEGSAFSVSVIPFDPEAYARALYAELHRADQSGVALILVEALPDTPEWQGVNDRLRRASFSE